MVGGGGERMELAARHSRHPVEARRDSAANLIRRVLQDEIVSMQRKPGEPISEKAIAAVFGVSRTPVREALIRLAEDGLVAIFPQSGTFVAPIPLAELPEAILVRETLEARTVSLAARRAGKEAAAELQASLSRQRKAARARDAAVFHREDEAFHALIAELAGFPGIWALVQQVKIHIDRFRHLTLPLPGRMGAIVKEHERIAAAINEAAPRRAEKAMADHLATMRAGLDEARRRNPDYFLDRKMPCRKSAEV